ncbi:adhesin protein Mad1 [Stagonosporopsis vannaccii]|nr:adhesin protein Mad1 [Stagonosporopsis vannaccii]
MKVSQIVLATGLIGHATATWNMFGNPFNSPNYNNNECSDKQKSGFDWSDLKDGDSNFNYGDFDFTGGWKCSNSFGKRDHLTRRTFGSKCIKNKVSKTKPASFGCNKRKSGFSITHIDVSVEYDVDIELHYHMEDGSKCKQVAPCKSSGSTIQNTQCGGAKSVDVYLPKHDKSDKECEIGFHNIGFDCNPGKGYNPPSPPSPPEIPASSAPVISQPATSSAPVVSGPATSAPPSSTPSCDGEECNTQPPATSSAAPPCDGGENCPPASSAPATEVPSTDASVPTPPATETPETPCGGYGQESCEGTTVVTSAPATETPATETPATETPVTSAPPATETPETPCGGYGQESCEGTTVVTSPPVETPILSATAPFTNSSIPATTAPPTEETTPAQPPVPESPSAPACDGSYGESCDGTTAVVTPPASSSVILTTGVPEPSSPPAPPVSPPDVLPKCMNTWLEVSGDCKNNADASCYCKNKDFTKQVIDCVSAWCGTDDETREALQYLIGICAEHVPENPGLVTDCPSYIPLNPTPATPTAPAGGASTPAGETGSTAAPEAPGTTPAPEVPGTTPAPEAPTGGVTGEVPAPPGASTPCTTITYGTTTLTIPQVHFTTQTNEAGAVPTEPVGLVQGTAPAQTPASTTAAPYPIAGTTLATFRPTGTGAYSPTAPAEFTGAAAPFKLEAQHAVLGALLAFFAL